MFTRAVAILWLAGATLAQLTEPSAEALLEQGRYRDALRAARQLDTSSARRVQIQAWLGLLEIDEVPPDLLNLIGRNLTEQAAEYGADSPQYGEALLWRGIVTKSVDDLTRARRLCAGQVESTCEAEALRNEGFQRAAGGDNAGGYRVLREAWEMHRTRLGDEHPLTAYAEALVARHCLVFQNGTCGQHAAHAVAALRRSQQSPHPYLASALNAWARQLGMAGDYREALRLYEDALRIGTSAFGPDSTRLIGTLGDLTVVYDHLGESGRALETAARTVRIAEAHLGSDHAVTGEFLGQLAHIQADSGDIATALRNAERAAAIYERANPRGTGLARSLVSLGETLIRAGDFPRARKTLERSRQIYRGFGGEDTYNVIVVRLRLGDVDLAMGRHADALREFSWTLATSRRILAAEGMEVQLSLIGRAKALLGLREHAQARADLHALGSIGAQSEYTRAQSHDLLSRAAMAERRWSEALEESQAALAGFRAVAGPDHADTVGPLARVARAHEVLGHRDEALASALESERVRRNVQRVLAEGLPERTALSAGLKRSEALGVLLRTAVVDRAQTARVWDAVIRSRALVLDAAAERARIARSSEDPALQERAAALADARTALAQAVLRERGRLSAEAYSRQLLELRERAERAEFGLADSSAAFRKARRDTSAGFDEMAARLPASTAVVAYVRSDDRFTVFVTRGDGAIARDLGPATTIDAMVRVWRSEIAREIDAGGRASLDNERRSRAAGLALRRAVWDPVRAQLDGTARVLLVPDGALTAVNFAALPTTPGRYLVATGPMLHLLSTERDLLADPPEHVGSGLLAVGEPAFGTTAAIARSRLRGMEGPCVNIGTTTFDALPGSAAEVRAIAEIWGASGSGAGDVLTSIAASKEAVIRRAEGKRVLHFATHAFFVPRRCDADQVLEDTPLLRAGIALAGANDPRDRSRGILTAAEVAGLRLDGTSWAVLSACDTGTGDVHVGEGVLGLQRAFLTAGARTVIASVWPVDDQESRRWMTSLYEAHFKRGLDTAQSVRAAQLARLETRRAAGLSTHPFYWAGFVAVGDWR